jgi:hypothetical protein
MKSDPLLITITAYAGVFMLTIRVFQLQKVTFSNVLTLCRPNKSLADVSRKPKNHPDIIRTLSIKVRSIGSPHKFDDTSISLRIQSVDGNKPRAMQLAKLFTVDSSSTDALSNSAFLNCVTIPRPENCSKTVKRVGDLCENFLELSSKALLKLP